MDLSEETPKPQEPALPEESFPEEPILPEGFTPIGGLSHLPRARRRRAQRMLVPPGADERAALLDGLARRAFPSFEFFLFAFLCGVILGAAYLLNAPALLLLGVLLAPLLTPWVGMTLAAVTGYWRFFFLTAGGLLVAGGLVFLTGALAGLVGRFWQSLVIFKDLNHSFLWQYLHLWPLDLLLVILGAVLLAISFVRSEQKPILASVMLAYGLFLPVSAAGIVLGIGKAVAGVPLWLNGLLVSLVHLALATLVGGIVLLSMRFRPIRAGGYILPVFLGLLSITALVVLTGLVTLIRDGIASARRISPTPTLLVLPSTTPFVSRTLTPHPTNALSATPSWTPTIQPTPSYALINSSIGGGALLRTEPASGSVITVLDNGLLVQVLPEIEIVGTVTWVRVRTLDTVEGWVLQSVLTATTLTMTPVLPTVTATPSP